MKITDLLYVEWRLNMKDNKYRTLFKALNRIKEENPEIKLIKIYYIDENNFTIKGINEKGNKCFSRRVDKDHIESGFDSDFRERVGKYK